MVQYVDSTQELVQLQGPTAHLAAPPRLIPKPSCTGKSACLEEITRPPCRRRVVSSMCSTTRVRSIPSLHGGDPLQDTEAILNLGSRIKLSTFLFTQARDGLEPANAQGAGSKRVRGGKRLRARPSTNNTSKPLNTTNTNNPSAPATDPTQCQQHQ